MSPRTHSGVCLPANGHLGHGSPERALRYISGRLMRYMVARVRGHFDGRRRQCECLVPWRGRGDRERRSQTEAAVVHIVGRLCQAITLVPSPRRYGSARRVWLPLAGGDGARCASKRRGLLAFDSISATPLSHTIEGRVRGSRRGIGSGRGRSVRGGRRAIEGASNSLDVFLASLVVEILGAPFCMEQAKVSSELDDHPGRQLVSVCLTRHEVLLKLLCKLHDVTAGDCPERRRWNVQLLRHEGGGLSARIAPWDGIGAPARGRCRVRGGGPYRAVVEGDTRRVIRSVCRSRGVAAVTGAASRGGRVEKPCKWEKAIGRGETKLENVCCRLMQLGGQMQTGEARYPCH